MSPATPNPLLFFGHMHPMLVHLPIGFLTVLAVVEIAAKFKRFRTVAAARGVILFVTVVSTIITISCGLMLSSAGGYDPSLLFWHKWLGIVLGCAVVATAWAGWKNRFRRYAALLTVTLLILVPASHFGGSMTHGKNYLIAYAPAWLRGDFTSPIQTAIVQAPIKDATSAKLYSDLVQPILQQNCMGCHDANKSSGELRLDSLASITRGGKSGPVITAGDSANSLLIQRIQLPPADARHMPPQGKPQPSEDQIELLRWWIDSGAMEGKSVADLNASSEQLELVSRLLKLPAPAEPGALLPVALADLQPQIGSLSSALGIVVEPVAADQPWIIVNASLSRSFGDKELEALSPLGANVVDLNLSGTHITDAGLAAVGQMTYLAKLRLDRTATTDAGLKQLAKLKKLENLNLYGTAVTDAGLKDLAALPELKRLYLWKTKVDPTAAAAFAASKTDANKIARMQKQIEQLQAEIAAQHVDVVQGISASTQPTTKP